MYECPITAAGQHVAERRLRKTQLPVLESRDAFREADREGRCEVLCGKVLGDRQQQDEAG